MDAAQRGTPKRSHKRPRVNFCVYLGIVFCSLFFVSRASAASFSFSPSAGKFTTQNNFTVNVVVDTNQAVNAVEGVVQFPANKLEVIGIDESNTIISMWVATPSFSNAGPVGVVQFSGIKLNPGFVGAGGKVLGIRFRVRDPGLANLTFGSGAILANDGNGTNLMSAVGSGIYTLAPASASPFVAPSAGFGARQSSPLLPPLPPLPALKQFIQDAAGREILFNTSDDAPKWSKNAYTKLTWMVPPDTVDVVTLLDETPDTEPKTPSPSSTVSAEQLFPFLSEGKHYFHIRFVNSAGAGPVLHYPLFIDQQDPKLFHIEFVGSQENSRGIHSTSNPRPRLLFLTEDALSGIDHYEIRIGEGDWTPIDALANDGTYTMPKQKPDGKQNLAARAVDRAGNETDVVTQLVIEPIVPPVITYAPRSIRSSRGPLVVDGHAAPLAAVEIAIEKKEKDVAIVTVKAGEDGWWRMTYAETLSAGVYAIRARQILDNDAESLYTQSIVLRVDSLYGQFLDWMDGLDWYILLMIFVVSNGTSIVYYQYRLRALRLRTRRDILAAEQSLRDSVAHLSRRAVRGESSAAMTEDLGRLNKKIKKKLRPVKKQGEV